MHHRTAAVIRVDLHGVWTRLVVAPPISSTFMPWRSNSPSEMAHFIESEGVIRPERPMMSAPSAFAVSMILVAGTVDGPRSITSKLFYIAADADNVLADVVHVALDGGEPRSCRRSAAIAGNAVGEDCGAFSLHGTASVGPPALHHAADFTTCGKKHFAVAEESPTMFHAAPSAGLRSTWSGRSATLRHPRYSVSMNFGDAVNQRV